MSTLDQLESEAHDLYPYPTEIDNLCRQVHVRARTVTAEHVDAAAEQISSQAAVFTSAEFWRKYRHIFRENAREILRAAGFYVEEESTT